MEGFDLLVVLGSQVTKIEREYGLAPHTKMKADAAIMAYKMRLIAYFLVSGGYNFGVRYDNENILPEVDFSFEAFTKTRFSKSEAEIIRDYMIENVVPGYKIFLEESSATTGEHAKFIKILLQRTTFDFVKTMGILTMIYHQRGFEVFEEEFYGEEIEVVPVYAENIIVQAGGKKGIERVCQYYQNDFPKTYPIREQFNIKRIREILEQGRNIAELLEE